MVLPRYRKLNPLLKEAFGCKTHRVGLWGGFTCPNRDGRLGSKGCIFCDPRSSEPLNHEDGMDLREQLRRGLAYIRRRHGAKAFIPYLQDFTATYGRADELEPLYRKALDHEGVVGLALGTRPDCLEEDVLDLLERLARETFLWVELGLQVADDSILEAIGRGHDTASFCRAVEALKERHIALSAHVILGLPGSDFSSDLATARCLAETGVHGVKIHNLHVVRATPLEEEWQRGRFTPLDLPAYVERVLSFLEQLPPSMIVQRVTGEAPRRLTVAPSWSVNKLGVMNAIHRALEEEDRWQGKALGASREDLNAPIVVPGLPRRD